MRRRRQPHHSRPHRRAFCPGAAPPRAPVSCAAGGGKTSSRGKDNVWSVDNERAAAEKARAPKHRRRRRQGGRRPSPPPSQGRRKGNDAGSRVLVSGAMLVEVETVLQTQEPVIKPSWDTFASSLSGNWKGVGAVFSPITAEMEPVGVGSKEEYLYDCYTLSHIEKSFDSVHGSEIQRKTNWVPINPFGEADKQASAYDGGSLDASNGRRAVDLPAYESFDLNRSNILDEGTFAMEPGIVFFEKSANMTNQNTSFHQHINLSNVLLKVAIKDCGLCIKLSLVKEELTYKLLGLLCMKNNGPAQQLSMLKTIQFLTLNLSLKEAGPNHQN